MGDPALVLNLVIFKFQLLTDFLLQHLWFFELLNTWTWLWKSLGTSNFWCYYLWLLLQSFSAGVWFWLCTRSPWRYLSRTLLCLALRWKICWSHLCSRCFSTRLMLLRLPLCCTSVNFGWHFCAWIYPTHVRTFGLAKSTSSCFWIIDGGQHLFNWHGLLFGLFHSLQERCHLHFLAYTTSNDFLFGLHLLQSLL